jgi:hypothetical protein
MNAKFDKMQGDVDDLKVGLAAVQADVGALRR